jgi:Uma2 family endonuclease
MNLVEPKRRFSTLRDEPPPPPPVDREAFQRWVVNQERRYEWVEGQIIMMTEVSRDHARIVTRLVIALGSLLDLDRYEIASSEFGVNTPGSRRHPDVLREPVGADGKGRTSESPIFLAEVLSPSSVRIDRKRKPVEYASISSLQTYAVFSQDKPKVWVWHRGETVSRKDRPLSAVSRHSSTSRRLGSAWLLQRSTAASAARNSLHATASPRTQSGSAIAGPRPGSRAARRLACPGRSAYRHA